jgi:hypothetical protein
MADERQFGTQDLVSAKYLVNAEEAVDTEDELPGRRAQPSRCRLEQVVRVLTLVVIIMLLTAAGGLVWLNRKSVAESAKQFRQHSSSGMDLLLWASGSKKTFSQALSERISRAQQDSAFQFDQKPAIKTHFDGVEFGNLTNAGNVSSPMWGK